MVNIFRSNVMIQIGEAIGGIGDKLLGKNRRASELVDVAFRNRLASGTLPVLNLGETSEKEYADDAIDVEYTVIEEE
jgi:hypothetical protein